MSSTRKLTIEKVREGRRSRQEDVLAAEEPLEIQLNWKDGGARMTRSLSVTMRTPGHDFELAAGFLVTEGVLRERDELAQIRYCAATGAKKAQEKNIVKALLKPGHAVDMDRLQRNFYATSSCGVCGKSSLEAVKTLACPVLSPDRPRLSPKVLQSLPERIRSEQAVFLQTGGLHAAALFDAEGSLLDLCEDVGRHNAVDKLVGRQFLDGHLPLANRVLLVSGRASFEVIQKAWMAGLAFVAAVGAPSSLAVDLARESGMTLVGFLKPHSFNVYSGGGRIAKEEA
jgi:FdhD protein